MLPKSRAAWRMAAARLLEWQASSGGVVVYGVATPP